MQTNAPNTDLLLREILSELQAQRLVQNKILETLKTINRNIIVADSFLDKLSEDSRKRN